MGRANETRGGMASKSLSNSITTLNRPPASKKEKYIESDNNLLEKTHYSQGRRTL